MQLYVKNIPTVPQCYDPQPQSRKKWSDRVTGKKRSWYELCTFINHSIKLASELPYAISLNFFFRANSISIFTGIRYPIKKY